MYECVPRIACVLHLSLQWQREPLVLTYNDLLTKKHLSPVGLSPTRQRLKGKFTFSHAHNTKLPAGEHRVQCRFDPDDIK